MKKKGEKTQITKTSRMESTATDTMDVKNKTKACY
jgi:hypothetical protein